MRPASKDTKSVFRSKPGPKPKKIKEEKVPYNKEKTRYSFILNIWALDNVLFPAGRS